LVATVFASGCGDVDKVVEESKQWRAVAETQTQVLVRAVPGERYLQLIDDLNSGDPAKVTRAQAFLKQLGHFDPAVNWEATIAFGFDEQKPMHSDAFFAFSPSKTQIEYFVQNALNPRSVTSSIELPQTATQLNQTIDSGVDQLMGWLAGPGKIEPSQSFGPSSILWWPESFTPTTVSATGPIAATLKKSAEDRQNAIRVKLKELLKAQYEKKSIPAGGTAITLPWFPTDGKNFLFVAIPESDWNQHKGDANFKVAVLLHKEGDATQSYLKTNEMIVDPALFEANPPVDRPAGLGKVRWAVIDPTHASASVPNVDPKQIDQVEKLLNQVIELNKQGAK
jgi:hypothetical protein